MKKLLTIFAVLITYSSLASASESDSVDAWLSLVDTGDYAKSWEQAAPLFQTQISSAKWEEALSKVRAPLGAVLSRETSGVSEHTSLPGVPDGKYEVHIFQTKFGANSAAIETVTLTKAGEDWRVVGYFIK